MANALLNFGLDDPAIKDCAITDTNKGKKRFGGKGWNLLVMAQTLGLPVPNGFIIPTRASRYVADTNEQVTWDHYHTAIVEAMERVEKHVGKGFGHGDIPLLVSIRSGAPVSMPGMMDTILNVGLNDETVVKLAEATNEDFAWDSYRRLVLMFASTVHGVDVAPLEEAAASLREFTKIPDGLLPADTARDLIDGYRKTLGKNFVPQDVAAQLELAVKAVWRSWQSPRAIKYREMEGIDSGMGTAVVVQSMVFGNMNDQSGTGVAFTKNPNTGKKERYGDFLINAQGEDVVAGTHHTRPLADLKTVWPEVGKELEKHMKAIEKHFAGDLCDIEFTVEDGKLYMLQTRIGKRTNEANVQITLDRLTDGNLTSDQARDILLEVVTAARNAGGGSTINADDLSHLATGLPATPGVAVGHVYFSADAAVAAAENGEDVILATIETSPDDVHGMKAAVGILTAKGGLVSHAAVVARGWGTPCVVACTPMEWDFDKSDSNGMKIGGKTLTEGDLVKIDGNTGHVYV